MFYSYLQVINPVLGLMINILVQVLCLRFIQRLGLLKSVFLGFFAGFLSVFIIESYILFTRNISFIDFFMYLIVNSVAYASFGYCYFHFINLGETARRIRILREIYDSKDGLSMEDILQRYNAKEIVEKRIGRLLNNGQVLFKNGKYYIGNPTLLMMSRIIVAMKLMLIGKRSEFEQ